MIRAVVGHFFDKRQTHPPLLVVMEGSDGLRYSFRFSSGEEDVLLVYQN